MPKENVTIEAVFGKIPFNAKFTKGEKQVYKINTDKSLVFSTTGERTKLKSVYIDKNWISAENFDITSKGEYDPYFTCQISRYPQTGYAYTYIKV